MAHTPTQDNVILSSLRYSGRLFIPNGNTTPNLLKQQMSVNMYV